MQLLRYMGGAALAAALVAGTAMAAPVSGGDEVWTRFAGKQVEALLTEAGFEVEPRISREGNPVLVARMPDGGRFVSGLTVCNQVTHDGCLGLHLFAIFEADAAHADVLAPQVNALLPFAKAFRTADGRLVLSRYIIADGGVAKANVFYNLTNFLSVAEGVAESIASGAAPADLTAAEVDGAALSFAPGGVPGDLLRAFGDFTDVTFQPGSE